MHFTFITGAIGNFQHFQTGVNNRVSRRAAASSAHALCCGHNRWLAARLGLGLLGSSMLPLMMFAKKNRKLCWFAVCAHHTTPVNVVHIGALESINQYLCLIFGCISCEFVYQPGQSQYFRTAQFINHTAHRHV